MMFFPVHIAFDDSSLSEREFFLLRSALSPAVGLEVGYPGKVLS